MRFEVLPVDAPGAPLFEANDAEQGGAISVADASTLFVAFAAFDANIARLATAKYGGGGAVQVAGVSEATLSSATFTNNSATAATGGALHIDTLSRLEANETIARGNYAREGGGFVSIDRAADVTFNTATFTANRAHGAGGGAMLVRDSQTRRGGHVVLRNNSFVENVAGAGHGGALLASSSDVDVGASRFFRNALARGGVGGGAVAALDNAEAVVSLLAPKCTDVALVIDWRETSRACLVPGISDMLACDGYLDTCQIMQAHYDCSGCACHINAESRLEIVAVDKTSGDDEDGATAEVIVATMTPRSAALRRELVCLVPGTRYEARALDDRAEGWFGGTFSIGALGPFAVEGNATTVAFDAPDGISASGLATAAEFDENVGDAGGAVFWDVRPPRGLKNATAASPATNIARDYGAFSATAAVAIALLDDDDNRTSVPHSARSGLLMRSPIVIALLDSYGIVVSSNSETSVFAALVDDDNYSATTMRISGANEPFVDGIAAFDALALIGAVGDVALLRFSAAELGLELDAPVEVEVVDCGEGFVRPGIVDLEVCTACLESEYWSGAAADAGERAQCVDCPAGAKCDGGTRVDIYPGYWRTGDGSYLVYECIDHKDACVGSVESGNSSLLCKPGHRGAYCSVCEVGYFYDASGDCARCDSSGEGWAAPTAGVCAFVLLGFAAMANFLVNGRLSPISCGSPDSKSNSNDSTSSGSGRTVRDHSSAPIRSHSAHLGDTVDTREELLHLSSVFKMFVSFCQILSGIGPTFHISWPSSFRRYVTWIEGTMSFDLMALLPFKCAMAVTFLTRVRGALSSVVAINCIFLGLWEWAHMRRRGEEGHKVTVLAVGIEHRVAYVWVAFNSLAYISVCSGIFQMIATCEEFDDGKTLMKADYSIDCSSSTFLWHSVLAWIFVPLWVLGVPLVFLVLLRQQGEGLYLAFLSENYRIERYFTEPLNCLQKVSVAGILAFMEPSYAQLLYGIVFAVFWSILFAALQPFRTLLENLTHTLIQFCMVLILIGALSLKLQASDEGDETGLASNAVVALLWSCSFMPWIAVIFAAFTELFHGKVFKSEEEMKRCFNCLKTKSQRNNTAGVSTVTTPTTNPVLRSGDVELTDRTSSPTFFFDNAMHAAEARNPVDILRRTQTPDGASI